jgi:hypothetical protein
LMERLREDRVRPVIQAVLNGDQRQFDPLDDDAQYVLDLGLIVRGGDFVRPANPIYAEVIPRVLTMRSQSELGYLPEPPAAPQFLDPSGGLDMTRLLQAFQEFWRENAESWIERFEYREAAPHLILMAFLQRVVSGGGRVAREYALGRGRIDLLVHFGEGRYPLELKLHRQGQRDPVPLGLKQLAAYMDTAAATEGWLVIFDQRPDRSWEERIFWDTQTIESRILHIIGC